MKKLVQIFQEETGKYSAKRVWGSIILSLCGIAFALDGLNFYDVNIHLFDSFLLSGTALLGLSIIKGIAPKK